MINTFAALILALGIVSAPTLARGQPAGASAEAVKCGASLGPGGAFVLDRDLTCPGNPDDGDQPALRVIEATLDLSGHTVTCGAGRSDGIHVQQATLVNGTVAGCWVGLRPDGSVVRNVTLSDNRYGMFIQGGRDSLIIGSTAIRHYQAFTLDDQADRNTLIGNTASESVIGFDVFSGLNNVLIANVATNNVDGFRVAATGARLQGNQARRNSYGFVISSTSGAELTGNIAKHNKAQGFLLQDEAQNILLRDNVAQGNGDDGFSIHPSVPNGGSASETLLKNNYAINNKGHGIHVLTGPGYLPDGLLPSRTTIMANTAIGHVAPHFDLAEDNAGCGEGAVWQDNVFATASQPCVH